MWHIHNKMHSVLKKDWGVYCHLKNVGVFGDTILSEYTRYRKSNSKNLSKSNLEMMN